MKQFNRESRDYKFIDKFEAGLVLTGAEAKSLRTQTAQFANSKIDFNNKTPIISDLNIPLYKFSQGQEFETTRDRQLLLKESEIAKLLSFKHQKYALIPISIYSKNRFFKLEFGVGKKIKKYEKREIIKAREFQKAHYA